MKVDWSQKVGNNTGCTYGTGLFKQQNFEVNECWKVHNPLWVDPVYYFYLMTVWTNDEVEKLKNVKKNAIFWWKVGKNRVQQNKNHKFVEWL